MAAPASRKRSGAAARGRGKVGAPSGAGGPIVVVDVDKFGGKWVATRRGRVVAAAEDFAGIRQAVRELGVEDDAILTRVPETGEFAY